MNTFIRPRAENTKYTIIKITIRKIRDQSYSTYEIKIITNKLVNRCERLKDQSNLWL